MASANCARYVGADVALIDIDPSTLNLDPAGVLPEHDALVAVHYAGLPVDLTRLAVRPRVVIEDAAHALGAFTPEGPVGNCAHSDMCCFSFHPVKPVTTAEGGVVTTNSDEYADALRRFRSHGIVRQPDRGGWYYEIDELGFNYRLTDLQAALGASQMVRLDEFICRRNAIADRYRHELADVPCVLPPAAPTGTRHGYHLFVIQVADRANGLRGASRPWYRRAGPLRADPSPSDQPRRGSSPPVDCLTAMRCTTESSRCPCTPPSPTTTRPE